MKKKFSRRWVIPAIVGGLFAAAMITTACSDNNSSTTSGGGPSGQSVVTIRGATQ